MHVGPSTRSMAKLLDTHAAMRFVTVNVFETLGAVAEIPTSTTSHDVASSESSESEAGLTRAYTRTRSGSASINLCGDMNGSRCAALLRMGRAIATVSRFSQVFLSIWRIFLKRSVKRDVGYGLTEARTFSGVWIPHEQLSMPSVR